MSAPGSQLAAAPFTFVTQPSTFFRTVAQHTRISPAFHPHPDIPSHAENLPQPVPTGRRHTRLYSHNTPNPDPTMNPPHSFQQANLPQIHLNQAPQQTHNQPFIDSEPEPIVSRVHPQAEGKDNGRKEEEADNKADARAETGNDGTESRTETQASKAQGTAEERAEQGQADGLCG